MLVRIKNKGSARKQFREGKTIILFPCKVNIDSPWWCGGIPINKDMHDTFDHLVNEFEWYHCNSETGYYTHFYIQEGDQS